MKRKLLIIGPTLIYLVILLSIPGMIDYLQLRYQRGIEPEKVEAFVVAMNTVYEKSSELIGTELNLTADEVRNYDFSKFREFISELNLSIKRDWETALLRTAEYHLVLRDTNNDIDELKKVMFGHVAEDYVSILNDSPDPRGYRYLYTTKEVIESMAEGEPILAECIKKARGLPYDQTLTEVDYNKNLKEGEPRRYSIDSLNERREQLSEQLRQAEPRIDEQN